MSYTFDVIGPDSEPSRERLDSFVQAYQQSFLESRASTGFLDRQFSYRTADRPTLRGVYLAATDGPELDGDYPVATFVHFDKTMTMPNLAQLGARMITDVTVRSTHRRKGLLRKLMTAALDDAAAAGIPLAILTATEATIYGRFGFGVVSEASSFVIDSSKPLKLRITPTGSTEMVDPRRLWPAAKEIFAGYHARVPGSVDRPAFYEDMVTGAFDFEGDGEDAKVRALLHRDEDGRADGYAVYSVEKDSDPQAIRVHDLVCANDNAYLALLEQLGSLDLVDRVRVARARLDEPLQWALIDRRSYRVEKVSDLVWARVLDPVAALETVAWRGDDTIVLTVEDAMGYAAGTFAVRVSRDGVAVERVEGPGEIRIAADTLAPLIFGTASIAVLVSGGRLEGDPAALERLASLAAHTPAPSGLTFF